MNKTAASALHTSLIRQFVADYSAEHWVAVTDLSLARQLRARQMRRPFLTTKETSDLTGDKKVRVLAAVWDEIGNIFALLPSGKRVQYIGR
jgi:hypothetical protein